MDNYREIIQHCLKHQRISAEVVDEVLLYTVSKQENFEKIFASKLKPYKHVINGMDEGFPRFLMSSFVVYQIFREKGLGKKYLKHRKVKACSEDEINLVKDNLKTPWRFAFFRLEKVLDEPILQMKDICTGESFTLYSNGTTDHIDRLGEDTLFFALIGFNGMCWETYGVISYLPGFIDEDILGFAKRVDSSISHIEDVPSVIAKNVVPFMMLFSLGEIPKVETYHGHSLLFCGSEIENCASITKEQLEPHFIVEESNGVLRAYSDEIEKETEFAVLVYDSIDNRMVLDTGNRKSYELMVTELAKADIIFPMEPDLAVSGSGVMAIVDILQQERLKREYYSSFEENVSPEQSEELERINACVEVIIKHKNAKTSYNLTELAREFDLPSETVVDLEMSIMQTILKNSDN